MQLYELVEKLEFLDFVSRVSRYKNVLVVHSKQDKVIAHIVTNVSDMYSISSLLKETEKKKIENLFKNFEKTPIKRRLLIKR